MFASAGQAWVFLATVYSGLAVGLEYDLLALLRRALCAGPLLTGLLDFMFWLAAAGTLAFVIAYTGGDGLRAYMLLGFVCGISLYAAGLRVLACATARLLGRVFMPIRRWVKKNRTKRAQQEGFDSGIQN